MSKNEIINKDKEDNHNENMKTIEVTSPTKSEKMSNFHKNKNPRSLFIRRINEEEKYKNYIQTEIDEYFNSPDKYFEKNSPISVNKIFNLKDINIFNKPQVRHITNKKSNKNFPNFSNLSPKKKTQTNVSSIIGTQHPGTINTTNIIEQLPKYEIIDNEKLKYIFESFNDKENKKSFIKENHLNLKIKNFPLDLSKSLSVQKRRLKTSRNEVKNNRRMSGFLSQRSKKSEKDLLINSHDSYLYKRELINNIHNKEFSEIYPRYYWKMNLRRDKNEKRKDMYVNIKNNYDPFWSVVIDNTQNKKEVKFKTGLDLYSKELKDFKKNKYLIENYSRKISNLERLGNLKIEGKNLYDVEYNREMSSKRRKILHRVFVENGKEVMDTDINYVFGEETLYKNYPKEIKYVKTNKSNSHISRNSNYNFI